MIGSWRRQAALVACVIVLATIVAGCGRKPSFVQSNESGGADADSAAAELRQIVDQWEQGAYEEAADLTAEVLVVALSQVVPESWRTRASRLLDSLNVGAEIASGNCALLVNFFSRPDPGAGSWPYLFWCEERGASHQRVEGSGLQLAAVVSRGLSRSGPQTSTPGVAGLFSRRGGGGHQPILMVWAYRRGAFSLVQTLGPDSLGGAGSGEFANAAGGGLGLITRTYRAAPYFEECPSCPHSYRTTSFRWGVLGFERVAEEVEPSPYGTFVEFIQAMMAGEWSHASRFVTHRSLVDAGRRFGWDRPQGSWRVAPVSEPESGHLVMFRGQEEAYRVMFEPRNSEWLISGFDPVPRTID